MLACNGFTAKRSLLSLACTSKKPLSPVSETQLMFIPYLRLSWLIPSEQCCHLMVPSSLGHVLCNSTRPDKNLADTLSELRLLGSGIVATSHTACGSSVSARRKQMNSDVPQTAWGSPVLARGCGMLATKDNQMNCLTL